MYFLTPAICPVHSDYLLRTSANVVGSSTGTAKFPSGSPPEPVVRCSRGGMSPRGNGCHKMIKSQLHAEYCDSLLNGGIRYHRLSSFTLLIHDRAIILRCYGIVPAQSRHTGTVPKRALTGSDTDLHSFSRGALNNDTDIMAKIRHKHAKMEL